MKCFLRVTACLLLLGISACKDEENTDRISVGEGGNDGTAATGGTASGGASATGGDPATGGLQSGGATASGGSDGDDLFHLTININAENRGRIVNSETGWECASIYTYCALSTVPGFDFRLVAEPLDGFVFSGWTDDTCASAGTGACVIDGSQAGAIELSAVFDPE